MFDVQTHRFPDIGRARIARNWARRHGIYTYPPVYRDGWWCVSVSHYTIVHFPV